MKTFAWWMIGVGTALILVAMVGGHYLQYAIGHDNASAAAALTGVVAGSLLMHGVILRIQVRRTIRKRDVTLWLIPLLAFLAVTLQITPQSHATPEDPNRDQLCVADVTQCPWGSHLTYGPHWAVASIDANTPSVPPMWARP